MKTNLRSAFEQKFVEWLNKNFAGREKQKYVHNYVQSGKFPQEFLDEIDKRCV